MTTGPKSTAADGKSSNNKNVKRTHFRGQAVAPGDPGSSVFRSPSALSTGFPWEH